MDGVGEHGRIVGGKFTGGEKRGGEKGNSQSQGGGRNGGKYTTLCRILQLRNHKEEGTNKTGAEAKVKGHERPNLHPPPPQTVPFHNLPP